MKDTAKIISFITLLWVGTTGYSLEVFTDHTSFTNEAGICDNMIDFETYGDGTIVTGDPVITGNEWLSKGVLFEPIDPEQALSLRRDTDRSWSAPSPTHGLSAGDNSSYRITFEKPVEALSMILCDSEYAGGYNEYIAVYDFEGTLLTTVDLPVYGSYVSGPEANYFFGFVSDVGISKVEIYENPNDGEGVFVDDICYTVPEPATMLLLGLGGLTLRSKYGFRK